MKLKQILEHIESWANELHSYSLTCTKSARKNKIDRLAADMDAFVLECDKSKPVITASSQGLQNLISRLDGVPTGDSIKDLQLATNLLNKDKK